MSRLHRSLLRLLPRDRRARDEDEIVRVFAELRASASRRERAVLWCQEIGGILRFSLREHSAPVVRWAGDPVGGSMKALSNWKFLVVAPTLVGAIVGLRVASRMPPQYKSEALIVTVSSKVLAGAAPSQPAINSEERVTSIRNEIMSRSRLERIIQDLDLYHAERASRPMEDVVHQFRGAINLATGPSTDRGVWFRLSYMGTDPKTVMRATDRLAALFIEESTRDRKQLIEGTDRFLDARIADTRQRLLESQKALEFAERNGNGAEIQVLGLENEALRTGYKALLASREDSLSAASIERRQMGEQFRLVDAARMAGRPIGPTRLIITSWGALTGLGIGLLLIIGRALWRSHWLRAETAS